MTQDSLPIGRVDNLVSNSRGAKGTLIFDQDDEFAKKVERKMRNRFLNAVSVSYKPIKSELINQEDHEWDYSAPRRYLETELVEVSITPVPADSSAVRQSYYEKHGVKQPENLASIARRILLGGS